MKRSKAVIRVPDISEALIKDKPYWVKRLLNLGYTKNQAEIFAEIYTFHMVALSKFVKKQATEMVHSMLGTGQDVALTMGWIAADIDRNDFFKRMQPKKAGQKKPVKKQKHKKSKSKGGRNV